MKLFGLSAVASTALVVAKLGGWASISWWVVFAPVLVVGGGLVCSVLALLLLAALAELTKEKK